MVKRMYTIINNNKYVLEIKKSTFIALLYKVDSIEEVNEYLKQVRVEYKDARHYCYAYVINDKRKFSDDAEPGGTAGLPIIEVLNKHNLNYVLCIVVRYFGGIKLGAGGLVRAYTKAASNVIEESNIVELISGYEIKIIVDYDKQKDLENIIKNTEYSKSFDEKVTYLIKCDLETLDKIKNANVQYTTTKEIDIKRKTKDA